MKEVNKREDQELFHAAEQGDLNEVEILFSLGADALARNSHHSVLHSAVLSDNKNVVKLVLQKIKDTQGNITPYIDAKDTEGDTPLMWTAESKYVNAARVLLEYGADVAAKNNDGKTALHWAATKNHVEILKLIIGRGANVNVKDKYGKKPLDYAREEGHTEVAGYLVFSLAERLRKQGQNNEALEAYQEALSIQEVVLGPDHLDTLMTRRNMSEVLSNQCEHSETLQKNQKINDIQKRTDVLGNGHPRTLKTLFNMAVDFSDQGNNTEFSRIFQEILKIKGVKFCSNDMNNLLTYYNEAEKIFNQGKSSDVSRSFREMLRINEDNSRVISFSKNHSVKKLDEEYLLPKLDELEAIKKDITDYLKVRISDVFIVRGKDRGKSCWHYALIDLDKKEKFHEETKTGSLDVADYGIILGSGWGENPPQNIIDKVNEFFNKSNDLFVIKENTKNMCCYHYIIIATGKREIFLEQTKTFQALDRKIKNCGQISYSGWGQDPPENILNELISTYFDRKGNKLKEKIAKLSTEESKTLHVAARDGKLETLRGFVRANTVDINGWTPLHHAAYVGNIEAMKFLVSIEVNLKVKDAIIGRMPVHIAAKEGHKNIIEFLLNKSLEIYDVDDNNWTPLHYATWGGHLSLTKLLIEKGFDIHAKEATRGKKPIHIAADRGYKDIVDLFLENGVEIDDTDREGRTSLYYAARKGHYEIVSYLEVLDADIHAENIDGVKPIHVACLNGHMNIIDFLIFRGANVNDSNNNNATPLHYAISEGQLGAAEFLLKQGANVNAIDKDSGTPLHDAAESGALEMVKFLLKNGANITIRNINGKTPLDLAKEKGHADIIAILDG